MADQNGIFREGVRSVPQVYFDFIARLVPGLLTMVSISAAVIGPGRFFEGIQYWLKELSGTAVAAFAVLIIPSAHILAMLLWCLWSWVMTRIPWMKYWDDEEFRWQYENVKSKNPGAGDRITKLKAQVHMTETLAVAFFLSSLVALILSFWNKFDQFRFLFGLFLLLIAVSVYCAAGYFIRHMKESLRNNLSIFARRENELAIHDRLVVLLDFDGTLVDLDKKTAYGSVVKDFGSGADSTLVDKLCEFDRELCAKGEYDRREVFEKYFNSFRKVRKKKLCQAFWRGMTNAQKVKPGCRETLKTLKDEGCVLVCVTDSDGFGGNKNERIKAAGLRPFFDKVFIGGEDGIPKKSSPEYMQYVAIKLALYLTPWVMVGDKVKIDLVPAQALDIFTILMENPEYPGNWDVKIKELPGLIPIVRELKGGI